MSQLGELDIHHYDRAIYDSLGADFLPFPNPDDHRMLKRDMRQVLIPGIDGPGYTDVNETDGRVPVVFDYPEDIYNRYLLPGLRIKRNVSIDFDEQRRFGWRAGHKYRVPSDDGTDVLNDDGEVVGRTHYIERAHAEPVNITYEIECRARYRRDAQTMRRYIRKRLKHESFLPVKDSIGEESCFTIFREGDSNVSELIESLNRFHGYMFTYRVEAEIDDYDEEEFRALTSEPIINVNDF